MARRSRWNSDASRRASCFRVLRISPPSPPGVLLDAIALLLVVVNPLRDKEKEEEETQEEEEAQEEEEEEEEEACMDILWA